MEPCVALTCVADDDPLVYESRKTLICLSEVYVHGLAKQMRHSRWHPDEKAALRLVDYISSVFIIYSIRCHIEDFFSSSDPQLSFLATRYLAQYQPYFDGYKSRYRDKLAHALSVAIDDFETHEWSSLDVAIANTMIVVPQFASHSFEAEPTLLNSILRYERHCNPKSII